MGQIGLSLEWVDGYFEMRVLVVSDIHAFTKEREGGSAPSYVKVGDGKSSSVQFETLVNSGGFPDFDIVLTPGDLGDRADPACVKFAWDFLNNVATSKKKAFVLGTTGNHDVDSRNMHSDFDVKGSLLGLTPIYPCSGGRECLVHKDDFERQLWFWAKNVYLHSTEKCRFVVMNSSAYHGMGRENQEFRHGRVSQHTIDAIKDALKLDDEARAKKNVPSPKINILVCHHHLEKDGDIDDEDYSEMKGAHALADFLSDSTFGRWMVIHGHRHRARLYHKGGGTGPIVLSAASFGATRDRDYSNTSPNQAHLIEFDFDAMEKHGYYPAGRISSWTWAKSTGWHHKNAPNGGLPPITGFGYRDSIDRLAREISDLLAEANTGVEWNSLRQKN